MLLSLIVILMKLVEKMSSPNIPSQHQQKHRNKCSRKENIVVTKCLCFECNHKNNPKELKLQLMSDLNNHSGKIVLSQQNQQVNRIVTTNNRNIKIKTNCKNLPNDGRQKKSSQKIGHENELNDEHLQTNVQIVLNNIHKRYNEIKGYLFNDKLNNNSTNYNNHKSRKMTSPASDTNSNPYIAPLTCSLASSQDFTQDFTQDYQWFHDFGYRDGITHQSILSALSASYNGIGELSYYEDLAKNLDANLAEVDIESFRTEDIHSLLTTLPAFCNENTQRRVLMIRNSCNNNKENSELDNSISKSANFFESELLFSPVKESHISVDSLDYLEGFDEEDDIILTCQANKNNYTIAFEGSVIYSDDSYYDGPENYGKFKQNCANVLDNIVKKKSIEMSRSETGYYTTWNKLRKNSTSQKRFLNGNNTLINQITRHAPHCFVRKSLSMPNLKASSNQQQLTHNHQLNVSQAVSNTSNDSFSKMRTLLPMYPIPMTNDSGSNSPAVSNNDQVQNQPSFNLVKLFIKQKSSSTDTCMDVSSGCWPSDSTSSGGDHNNHQNNNHNANVNNANRYRKKSMNDSGKCSALSKHDEEDYQYDSLDAQINNTAGNECMNNRVTNDYNREIFDSPVHKRNYKGYSMNIAKNHPVKNPVVYNLLNNNSINNNNNSFKDTNSEISRTSENLTQIFNNSGNNNTINSGKTKIPIEMITTSMQTSALIKSSQTQKETVRIVPPSFLAQLNQLGAKTKAPVYVIYPNYALPDLGFLKPQNEIVLSPLVYEKTFPAFKKPRPVSMNDIETLKNTEYKHINDWKSLITLLPHEYLKLLRNIPEAVESGADEPLQKPLFCMSPPLRRIRAGVTCDCVNILNTTTITSSSSGGSSSQPPSSGFRGSSTMLTDSEMDLLGNNNSNNNSETLKNLFVYQYDSPAELSSDRPPSGRIMPKGILRRTAQQRSTPKSKRNSMFEDQHINSQTSDKRRSLQDPYFMAEEEDMDLVERVMSKVNNSPIISMQQINSNNRLPTLPKMREYEELNAKLNRIQQNYMPYNQPITITEELEARIRAENFLSHVPKSELKHYAEIANILDTTDDAHDKDDYDRSKLRNEVSKALSQRKVSFNDPSQTTCTTPNKQVLLRPTEIKFSTPPNSPNMSVAAAVIKNTESGKKNQTEREKQDKIQSNRFKRLQIQWELLSKEGNSLKQELAGSPQQKETKSGGNTPTSAGSNVKSRIPRPVSYPTSKTTSDNKNLKSPSRIVPPKKYATSAPTKEVITPMPAPRSLTKTHATTTPKKTVPRATTRTR